MENPVIKLGLPKGRHIGDSIERVLKDSKVREVRWSEIYKGAVVPFQENGEYGIVEPIIVRPRDLANYMSNFDIFFSAEDKLADLFSRERGFNFSRDGSEFRDLLNKNEYEYLYNTGINPCYIGVASRGLGENWLERDCTEAYSEYPWLFSRYLDRVVEGPLEIKIGDDVFIKRGGLFSKPKKIQINYVEGSAEEFGYQNPESVIVNVVRHGRSLEERDLVPLALIFYSRPFLCAKKEVVGKYPKLVEEIKESVSRATERKKNVDSYAELFATPSLDNKYPGVAEKFWNMWGSGRNDSNSVYQSRSAEGIVCACAPHGKKGSR